MQKEWLYYIAIGVCIAKIIRFIAISRGFAVIQCKLNVLMQ